MRQHSPVSAEWSPLQGLTVLQRSRSPRDPSMSPSTWNSYSARKRTKNPRRRSLGVDNQREVRRFLGDSLLVVNRVTPDVAVTKSLGEKEIYDDRGSENVEDARKSYKSSHLVGRKKLPGYGRSQEINPGLSSRNKQEKNEKISHKGNGHQNLKALSNRLKEFLLDSEDVESSKFLRHEYLNRSYKATRHRPGCKTRTLSSVNARNLRDKSEMSIASKSFVHGLRCENVDVEGGQEEYVKDRPEASQVPHSRCGILWNWSSIHHGGKTCMDMAGRSLSCGLPNSMLRRSKGHVLQGQKAISDLYVVSDHSSSSLMLDHDGLPLLTDKLESHDHSAFKTHECSGNHEIFSDSNPAFSNNILRDNQYTHLVSEASSGSECNSRKHIHGRHQSLMEKYMPRTFEDLVGQNLVVQALSNAIAQRKIEHLYVFYGPRGTGKTSCARIFAHALNCQSLNDSKPCRICDSCIACELRKGQNVREVNTVGNFNLESVVRLLESMDMLKMQYQYGAIIIDDCDALPVDSWRVISKVIDLAPRHVVFILICTSIDHLPHTMISSSQKFYFQKLKDVDIISTLQEIAENEGLEIDKDSVKLIASRSGGSLMDAEMTLDHLSLLGQRISLPLVQELVGLISNEKLVDLLASALSADTVNTIKKLRGIIEAGVEPLELMSQLAALITDILAGSYVLTTETQQRRFFQQPTLSKKHMENLRRALKILSEAEKQLRVSSDKLTWLAAALLQFAPDQHYIMPGSSAEVNLSRAPNQTIKRNVHEKCNSKQVKMPNHKRGLSTSTGTGHLNKASSSDGYMNDSHIRRNKHAGVTPQTLAPSPDVTKTFKEQIPKAHNNEIWLAVLENIHLNSLKQLMNQGMLISVSFDTAPSARLMFSSHANKCKAEQFRAYIVQAFESVLGSPVSIEITCQSRKDMKEIAQVPFILPSSEKLDGRLANQSERLSKEIVGDQPGPIEARHLQSGSPEISKTDVEIRPPKECKCSEHVGDISQLEEKHSGSASTEAPAASHHQPAMVPLPEERKIEEQPQIRNLARNRVTLAQLLQQTEEHSQRNELIKYKAVSSAKNLKKDNLRLKLRSTCLCCWKISRIPSAKIPHLRGRKRKSHTLLKFIPCSRCLHGKSSRQQFCSNWSYPLMKWCILQSWKL